jgi:hypothetical protein
VLIRYPDQTWARARAVSTSVWMSLAIPARDSWYFQHGPVHGGMPTGKYLGVRRGGGEGWRGGGWAPNPMPPAAGQVYLPELEAVEF